MAGSGVCTNDGSFGPGADCRQLDFTLYFEYIFLLFIPALILTLLSFWRIYRLYPKKRSIKAWSHLPLSGKALLVGKVGVAGAGVAAQGWWLGIMGNMARRGTIEGRGWWVWAGLGMGLVASILILLTVTLEHLRSHRPSQVPALDLLLSSLFLSAILRTEALISSSSPFIPPIAFNLATHVTLFVVLQVSARSSLINTDVPPGATSGLVSRYLIAWCVPLLWRGFRKPLKLRDLGEIDTSLHTSETWRAFEPQWVAFRARADLRVGKKEGRADDRDESNGGSAATNAAKEIAARSTVKQTTRQPLLRALFAAFTGKLCAPLLPALIACVTSLARPLLISRTILFVQSYSNGSPDPQPLAVGYGLVGAAALTYTIYSLSYLLEHLAIQRSALALRGALMEALFRKSLKIRVETAVEMGAAKASNLMSTDVDNVVRQVQSVHDVWTALVLTGLGLYIIWTQIGLSFLAAVVGAVIFFALLPPLTRHVGAGRIRWAEAVDRRIKFTSSVLRHIKAIKLSAYEPRILSIANGMRNDELNAFVGWVKQILKVSIMTNWLSHGLALMTVTTYTLVVVFSGSDTGQGVTTARIFTVISTIELISMPLLELGQKIGALLTAWASLKRIEGFLMDGEKGDDQDIVEGSGEGGERGEGGLADSPFRGRAASASRLDDQAAGGTAARVVLRHATFGVDGKIDLLHDLNVELERPGLWMITGRVGCGKSSLLQALIGELDLLPTSGPDPESTTSSSAKGHVDISLGTIGYCSQDPWLRANGTVRENIIFDKPYEAAWYRAVLDATALGTDVAGFEEGDRRVVSGLSGGQKQRVALARAIYGQFDSLILDDPFSALDATTEAQVFSSLFSPTGGLLHGKTVIIATNQIHRLMSADYVTILQNGRVAEQGTYKELNERKGGMLRLLVEEFAAGAAERERNRLEGEYGEGTMKGGAMGGGIGQGEGPSGYNGGGSSQELSIVDALAEPATGACAGEAGSISSRSRGHSPSSTHPRSVSENRVGRGGSSITSTFSDPSSTSDSEHNTTGRVPFSVYLLYLRGLGYVSAFFWVTIVMTNAIIQLCVNIYLQAWTGILGHTSIEDRGKYGQFLGGYAGMTLGYLLAFALGIYHAFVNSHPVASRRMHHWMMSSVLGTSLTFFEKTPIGQVVNRFNTDLNMLDMILPNHAVNFMFFFTTVVGSAAIIIVADPVMAAVVVGTAIVMVLLQRFYVRAGRELRRLDMITRSPIYTLFSETIDPDGLRTIRAMKAEGRSVGLMTRRATESQYPAWLLMAVQKWLELALNLACTGINILLILVAVLNRRSASAGILAVALTQAAQLNTNLMVLVVEWTNVEMCITSVERIKEYINLPPQTDDGTDDHDQSHRFPPSSSDEPEDGYFAKDAKGSSSKGKSPSIALSKHQKTQGSIVFRNVVARYGPHLPPALKGLSIAIKPGQRVGICGRTGSGKSTLLAVLWRLIDYDAEEGEVLVDGREIGERSLAGLRGGMSIIPQDPLLLDLTVRQNIDIEGLHSDTEIWNALEQAQLKAHITSFPLGLSHPITDTSLSRGQRQLLALARAILRSRPILALDEATSSIDSTTDAMIQQTIRDAFEGKTVLTIAHRIGTIVDYDVVVVMQDGRVVEMGEPGVLIERKGRFWELARESGVISG